ncbi:MAG: hypothetical protein ACRC8S_12740 [Fimbriiglobus sp.]
MSRAALILTIVLAGIIPIWGCNQSTSGLVNSSLEARIVKLEREFKAAESARDAAEARAKDLEGRWKAELARAQSLTRERDEAQAALKSRTSEKDQVQTQLDGFKKGLKDLLNTMESGSTATTQKLPAPVALPVSTNSKMPTVVLPFGNATR